MLPFEPTVFYGISDQCGPGKIFGSRPARDKVVKQGLLHPGFLVGGRRKNLGVHLNAYLPHCQMASKTLPEGFGGAQPNAGRRKHTQTSATT
jgi:hypothetical protein